MTTTLTNIEPLVRSLIGDYSIAGTDIFTYSSSAIFTLSESNIVSVDAVSVNDVESGVTYSFDSTRNKLTVTSGLTVGDIVQVDYTMYNDYSSNEIQQYIKAAIYQLTANNYTTYILEGSSDDELYPEPDDREQRLIALVAAILIKPENRSYRLPDITINVSSKELPTDQKISRIVAIFKKAVNGTYSV